MLVKAKWQIAYNGMLFLNGDVFEIKSNEYAQYQDAVTIVLKDEQPKLVKKVTKMVKTSKNKQLKNARNK